MTRVVGTLSGGHGSWAADRRAMDKYGVESMTLLFTDVGDGVNPEVGEHPDTYRFLHDAADDIGAPLIYLQDGRNIWDVFREKRWLGNASLSHCSWELKTKPARAWMAENCDPADTVVIIGIDWTETARLPAVHAAYAHDLKGCADKNLCRSLFTERGRAPGPGCKNLLEIAWAVEAPLTEKPYLAKPQVSKMLRDRGIKPNEMYALGFGHANCIGCVKAGQAHWERVLAQFPDTYAYHEQQEREIRADLGDVSILKDRRNGDSVPLTLERYRVQLELEPTLFDVYDEGGCACGVGENPETAA